MSNETLQTISQVVIVVAVILGALGGFGSFYFGKQIEKAKEARQAYIGRLEARSQLILDPNKGIYPKLELGDSGSILKFAGKSGQPIFSIAGDNDIIIEVEDGQVKLTASIRDAHGSLIAKITKNEWQINPDRSWDRNYSEDAIEVMDASGDIILQARLIEDRVQFQAKLYDSNGTRIGFGSGFIERTGPRRPELELRIQPLFKYPSNLHLGEFVER